MKNYESSIKCYDSAIRIDPNLIDADSNKKIVLKIMEKMKMIDD